MENAVETVERRIALRKRGRGKRWLIALLLLLLAAAVAVVGWFVWHATRPVSKYDLDRNALAGFLPGHSQAEIEAELNRIIDEGRFAVSINPTPVVADGKVNLLLENVPANRYDMQVDVYLTQEDGPEELLYRSGLIKQGFYIESGDALITPTPGEYNGRAIFTALMPDEAGEEIGQTEATLLIFVEDEG